MQLPARLCPARAARPLKAAACGAAVSRLPAMRAGLNRSRSAGLIAAAAGAPGTSVQLPDYYSKLKGIKASPWMAVDRMDWFVSLSTLS